MTTQHHIPWDESLVSLLIQQASHNNVLVRDKVKMDDKWKEVGREIRKELEKRKIDQTLGNDQAIRRHFGDLRSRFCDDHSIDRKNPTNAMIETLETLDVDAISSQSLLRDMIVEELQKKIKSGQAKEVKQNQQAIVEDVSSQVLDTAGDDVLKLIDQPSLPSSSSTEKKNSRPGKKEVREKRFLDEAILQSLQPIAPDPEKEQLEKEGIALSNQLKREDIKRVNLAQRSLELEHAKQEIELEKARAELEEIRERKKQKTST